MAEYSFEVCHFRSAIAVSSITTGLHQQAMGSQVGAILSIKADLDHGTRRRKFGKRIIQQALPVSSESQTALHEPSIEISRGSICPCFGSQSQ